ncbi:hypothetical protein WN73_37825 [Bradyrhizobium sp. CCBAU 45394]|uniref:hypothetical protein n=1 Tax=Bradyrhizobium sp. CCBAU 45394 TaxID=1325087 RepID=UPI002302A244|nr:hypothetical protein [Bradyrhizobium sp. CCBAU 45394]MDA9396275.1 hypothetical protein [Bradyrhizobium sp. CCBAU 45394]
MNDLMAVPEWTQVRQKSGLDPLGLQAASVRLYQALLPGISNVTLRTRYYGLYAWLSEQYAKRNHDADSEAWKRTVRRAEALYALTAARANLEGEHQETGVAGVLWAQRRLAQHEGGAIDFAAHADPGADSTPYLQQAWGAFGAAYESQLREAGVLGDAEAHSLSVPTEIIGDDFSGVFARAAGEAGEKFLKIVKAGRVSLNTLDELAPILPSRIHPQSHERDAYERMLFAGYPDATENDHARRKTLTLVLRVIQLLGEDVEAGDMRWLLYAGHDWEGKSIEIPEPELETQRRGWWAYQAGDLGRMAYEALLKWLLDTLESYQSGLTTDQLIDAALDRLEVTQAGWPKTWSDLVAALPKAGHCLASDEPTSELALSWDVLEAGTDERQAPVRSAQAAIELMAVLTRQCADHRQFFANQHGGDHPDAPGRSFANELSFLDGQAGTPIPDLLRLIFKKRILQRHLWVAMRKLQYQRDYTFLVETHDGRLRLRAKDGPVATNPRLGPALTFLKDIHLVDENGLTKRGNRLASAA